MLIVEQMLTTGGGWQDQVGGESNCRFLAAFTRAYNADSPASDQCPSLTCSSPLLPDPRCRSCWWLQGCSFRSKIAVEGGNGEAG